MWTFLYNNYYKTTWTEITERQDHSPGPPFLIWGVGGVEGGCPLLNRTFLHLIVGIDVLISYLLICSITQSLFKVSHEDTLLVRVFWGVFCLLVGWCLFFLFFILQFSP